MEVLDFPVVQVDGSHRPGLVEAILKAQCAKLVDPHAVVVGPRRQRRRVHAAHLDAVPCHLSGQAQPSRPGADHHHVESGAVGPGAKQGKVEDERVGSGLGSEVEKVDGSGAVSDLEAIFGGRGAAGCWGKWGSLGKKKGVGNRHWRPKQREWGMLKNGECGQRGIGKGHNAKDSSFFFSFFLDGFKNFNTELFKMYLQRFFFFFF